MLAIAALSGCTQVLHDAPARKQVPVGPIAAGQVSDLLSEGAGASENRDLFAAVEPEECAGLAQEVDPPFIFDITPAAADGGQRFADNDYYSVQEMVGVFHEDYNAAAVVDEVRRTVADCSDTSLTVTTSSGDVVRFTARPGVDSGSPEIVLWRLESRGRGCDNAFVAAYNAAVYMTACGDTSGFDITTAGEEALARINALADRRA